MMKWVWVFFLFPLGCDAAPIATCQADGTFLNFNRSANTSLYVTDSNDASLSTLFPTAIVITDIPAFKSIPRRYRKCVDRNADGKMDAVVEMTRLEKDAENATGIAERARQQRLEAEVLALRRAGLRARGWTNDQITWYLDRR